MEFTHLHVHSEYSLLASSAKINALVDRAVELGMKSLAITDYGVMFGAIDFYKAARKAGIKPIIGCEIYTSPGPCSLKEPVRGENRYYSLILLAKNNTGYHNLCKIVSKGYTEGFYYKPRVDMDILREYSEGIIALSSGLSGEIAINIRNGRQDRACEVASSLNEIFGTGNFYLELEDHGIIEQRNVNDGVLRISKETGIPLVATNDVHYINAEDAEAHDILLCIKDKAKINDPDRMKYIGGQYYLKSVDEMDELFPYAREAIGNTQVISDACNVDIIFGEQKVPKFEVPEGYDSYTYLKSLCDKGLRDRYSEVTKEHQDRLQYELDVIKSMGFVDYFLIVWDFIFYAKSHGIAVGPGRGSAAGSIVSYSLGITNIDPIRFNLLFERFLNPERVTMPDIDVDFCYERRQEVIDYVVNKYGKEKVVQIVTFGTLAPKMCVRDVARAMDYPYYIGDKIAKLIPNDLHITLDKAVQTSKDLQQLYEEDEDARIIIDMSRKLEGVPRHTSMHAAGVVIGRDSIDEYVPLYSKDNVTMCQYNMTTIEELGLLKMDFLGLRTLTVIQETVQHIRESQHIDIDIDSIGFDDKDVYDLISSGKTEGIFQLESSGMKNFMKELKPHSIEDIIAGISLYRPGPMDFIPQYIKGKNNTEEIIYDDPRLEKILSPTYGCIVYQEQVMQIVMELAGYSLGRSDLVRRAMSKKKADVMMLERQNFVYGNESEGVPGCVNRGVSEEVGNKIFDEMIDFASYAFNKSHAAAYAVVAYQTAYLKCHFPTEFMASLISSVKENSKKVSGYIQNCKAMGISILPPDINEGKSEFSVSGKCIRYGLSALKSVGDGVTDIVRDEVVKNGPFSGLDDFIRRLSNKEANKRTIESFICAGAFDSFGYNRKQLFIVYPLLLDQIAREKKKSMEGQLSFLDIMHEQSSDMFKVNYPIVDDFPKEELLAMEKDMLGIYISGHPLDEYTDIIDKYTSIKSADFDYDENYGTIRAIDRHQYRIAGMVEEVTVKTTKSGDNMAFITLEDMLGTVEVIVFASNYRKYKDLLVKNAKLLISGTATVSEEEAKLILNDVVELSSYKTVWVCFNDMIEYSSNKDKLERLLAAHTGLSDFRVQLLKPISSELSLKNKFKVGISDEFINELKKICGDNRVVIR